MIGSAAAPYVNALARRYGTMTAELRDRAPVAAELPRADERLDARDRHRTAPLRASSARNIVDQLEARADLVEGLSRGRARAVLPRRRRAAATRRSTTRSPTTPTSPARPARCAQLVGFGSWRRDLRAGALPTYVWITPNLCDDGHDCGVAAATASSRGPCRRCCASSARTACSC